MVTHSHLSRPKIPGKSVRVFWMFRNGFRQNWFKISKCPLFKVDSNGQVCARGTKEIWSPTQAVHVRWNLNFSWKIIRSSPLATWRTETQTMHLFLGCFGKCKSVENRSAILNTHSCSPTLTMHHNWSRIDRNAVPTFSFRVDINALLPTTPPKNVLQTQHCLKNFWTVSETKRAQARAHAMLTVLSVASHGGRVRIASRSPSQWHPIGNVFWGRSQSIFRCLKIIRIGTLHTYACKVLLLAGPRGVSTPSPWDRAGPQSGASPLLPHEDSFSFILVRRTSHELGLPLSAQTRELSGL